jgi:hypothetical protein
MAENRDTEPSVPRGTDEENPVMDTASSKPLREAKIEEPDENDSRREPETRGVSDGDFKSARPGFDGRIEPI